MDASIPPVKSTSTVQREYYANGVLKSETPVATIGRGSLAVGIAREYGPDGKVTKTIDFEKDYKITLEKVLEICRKRKIDITHRLSSLNRTVPPEKPVWYVGWDSGKEGKYMNHSPVLSGPTTHIAMISIDGVTGEIKELPGHDHLDN